ncbi:MAG: class B sortase [Hydrogenoanaerobacterium sp.]
MLNNDNYRQSSRKRTRRVQATYSKKIAVKAIVVITAVLCCGLGAVKLVAMLVQNDPIVVAEAATTNNTPDTVEGDIVILNLPNDETDEGNIAVPKANSEANSNDIVLSDDLPVAEGTPDYSEDALVVSYLDPETEASAHPLLDNIAPDIATKGSAGEGIPNAPVDLGGSGYSNIVAWKNTNKDTVGWLKIPGTNINYPVVQGAYTNYYTSLGYNKKYSKDGVIWADSACNMGSSLSPNTVIYGHNWTNYGSVPNVGLASDTHFAQLTAFQHLSFAQQHPYFWFSTPNGEMQWQIFAAFYTDINFNYIDANGGMGIVNGAKARSEHIYDVPVSADDKIITLSTCTRRFGKSNRQRFVVMAKLVDSVSSSVSITKNPNPVRPKL